MPAGIHRFLCPIGLIIGSLSIVPLSPPLAGPEFPQSIRRVFYWFPQSAGSILEPSLFFNASAAFDADAVVAPRRSALFLSLIPWPALNFRRVSAEYFISFRRVPGQFLSPPFFSTPALLLQGMSAATLRL